MYLDTRRLPEQDEQRRFGNVSSRADKICKTIRRSSLIIEQCLRPRCHLAYLSDGKRIFEKEVRATSICSNTDFHIMLCYPKTINPP